MKTKVPIYEDIMMRSSVIIDVSKCKLLLKGYNDYPQHLYSTDLYIDPRCRPFELWTEKKSGVMRKGYYLTDSKAHEIIYQFSNSDEEIEKLIANFGC